MCEMKGAKTLALSTIFRDDVYGMFQPRFDQAACLPLKNTRQCAIISKPFLMRRLGWFEDEQKFLQIEGHFQWHRKSGCSSIVKYVILI